MSKTRKGLRPGLRFSILQRDNFTCRYCGASAQTSRLEVDHILAVSNGGNDRPDNLVTACEACNAGKSSKTVQPIPIGGLSWDERNEFLTAFGMPPQVARVLDYMADIVNAPVSNLQELRADLDQLRSIVSES